MGTLLTKYREASLKSGFTLIELLVSFAIFAVVATAATGALLTLVDANRKAQETKIALNNLNFALESMARNIRTGYNYRCGLPDPGNPDCNKGKTLYFESDQGDPSDPNDDFVYRFVEGEDGESGKIERSVNGGGTFFAMTAPEIDIKEFRFVVTGARRGIADHEQPRVRILAEGVVLIPGREKDTSFFMQTTATERVIDY